MRTLLRSLKWTGLVLAVVLVALTVAIFCRQDLRYEAPLPDLHASTDSLIIARGDYLVNGPAHCSGCHTDNAHEAAYLSGEAVPMHGAYEFKLPVGSVFSRNITNDAEHGIGRLTDPEIARTLRYGVGSDGRAIFDLMPFYMMSDEDLTAVISYLRTVPGDPNEVPPNDLNFVGKAVNAFMIKPMGPLDVQRPVGLKPDTTVIYGEYLANSVANCAGCHTARDLMTGAFTGA
ncbi:MAG TPA: cytochrome c, partial [Flavobacteriales bacterium]|nr:cytochrome c [Flavobacteriales bacterium]